MFFINTVIGHLFHVVPGARYNRMYGSHFNPYTWQTIDQTADHLHWASSEKWSDTKKGVRDHGKGSDATSKAGGGHAHCGFMIYQGDNWPDEFRNRAFTLNFHGRRINQEILVREGNSFVGKHGPDMFQTADPWFRGVELTYGPDGAVYVLDWSDIGECHDHDGIHRTSGRIFKISYGKPKKPEFDDLHELPTEKLVEFLWHKNGWYPRMAMRILRERSLMWPKEGKLPDDAQRLIAQLAKEAWLSDDQPVSRKLIGLWTLYGLSENVPVPAGVDRGFFEDMARSMPKPESEQRLAWMVRLLSDKQVVSKSTSEAIAGLAGDSSSLVRLYVAAAIGRLNSDDAFAAAKKLVTYEEDMNDRVQPKLIWQQIEPFIVNDYDNSMQLFAVSKSQMIRRNIVRRLACDPEKQDEMLEKLTSKWVLSSNSFETVDILNGIKAALEGRTKMKAPASWPFDLAKGDSESAKLVAEISPVFGDSVSLDRLMKLAADKGADTTARNQAILSLSQFADPEKLFPLLKSQINDRKVHEAVVKSMSVCDQEQVAKLILRQYDRLPIQGKRNAIDTLCVRKSWAMELLGAVKRGVVSPESVTAWHARQIQLFGDEALTEQLTSVWGKVRETDQERLAQIDSLREMMKKDLATADVASGKKLFATHCASCHAMFGEGKSIGPDLTGADRKNLNYLLENIVDPSATVATTFRASVLAMEDGRLLTGVVMENNGQTLKLQTQDELLLTLEVDSVEEIKQTELSLMPEKLLDKLSDKQKVDLFGYLMSK